jgi:adenosine deaminase
MGRPVRGTAALAAGIAVLAVATTASAASPELTAFLRAFPKGAELHTHLSGAVRTTSIIEYGAAQGDVFTPPDGTPPFPFANALTPGSQRRAAIDGMSVYRMPPGTLATHNHFFVTFGVMPDLQARSRQQSYAEVTNRAARAGLLYQEIMQTYLLGDIAAAGAQVGMSDDLESTRTAMLAGPLTGLIAESDRQIRADMTGFRQLQRCGTATAAPGCGVRVRLIWQSIRVLPPADAYALMIAGFELAHRNPYVVGNTLVDKEEAPESLRDFPLHMRMYAHLRQVYRDDRINLHAGEMTPEFAPRSALRDHIRASVNAGSRRVGHGVDIKWEDGSAQLMRLMARRRIAVEVNLKSNEVLLGIQGRDSQFDAYRRAGVPMVLGSDDQGEFNSGITDDWLRAVTRQKADYPELITLARNSLEYSFAPGHSIWVSTAPRPWRMVSACATSVPGVVRTPACAAYVNGSLKARLQWDEERRLGAFVRAHPVMPTR